MEQLTKEQKIILGIIGGILISLFLPWYSASVQSNVNVLGQSYGGGYSSSYSGYQMGLGILPIIISIATGYLVYQDNVKIAFYLSIVFLIHAANIYFGLVGFSQFNYSASAGQYGGVSSSSGYTYGFYIYSVLSIAAIYLIYKQQSLVQTNSN